MLLVPEMFPRVDGFSKVDISPSHGLKLHSESWESQLGGVKRRSGDVLKMKIPQKCQNRAGTKRFLI